MFVCVSQKYKTFLFQKVHSNVLCKWMLRDCGPSCQTCFGIGIFLKGMRSAYWRKVVQRNLIWNFYGEKTALLGKNKIFSKTARKLQEGSFGRKLYFPRWHDMVIFLAAIDKYIKCHPPHQIMSFSRVFVYSLNDFNGIRISNTSIECPCTRRVH